MVLYDTLITVITCTITEILHGLLLHIDVSLVHRYTNARTTACHIIGYYHRYMDSRHITVTHACMVVIWLLVHVTCIIVPLYQIHGICLVPVTDIANPVTEYMFPLLIWMFPLLDTRAVDMLYVESHIYCSRFPLYCSMLSPELRSS